VTARCLEEALGLGRWLPDLAQAPQAAIGDTCSESIGPSCLKAAGQLPLATAIAGGQPQGC